ncbi:reduced epidermal fluorescence 4 [Actinidia rufa]|uniref:Reduced epidermal fluorescence 4 n=1 Tax=Actinidia rufa TaxID=165716 RepID=A0A7J0H8N1_9ERIC|nr:reduced epidermal fluorescence 4 [Actinidia rufa]
MAVASQRSVWDNVIEMTKSAQERGGDPVMWAIQLSSALKAAGVPLPSTELADLLVFHICWSNNVPIAVIPSRRFHPAAYRLYMELLKRHAFSFASQTNCPNYKRTMKSIYEVLHLSQIFSIPTSEPGQVIVGFVFSIVWRLLDASLDDEGLLELTPEKKSRWLTGTQDMEIHSHDSFNEKRTGRHEGMCKINTVMAVEIIGDFFKHKVTSRILYLARRNMRSHWLCFIQHLRLLTEQSSALRSSKDITPEALLQLTSDTREVLSRKCKTSSQKQFHAVMASGSLASSASQCHGTSRSALWLPFDLFLEDAMDGSKVTAMSAVEVLMGLAKALQAVNQTTWQDTFLGLWIAALRLVQRERDPSEGQGPVPRLDTCLCMLLSVTTLAIFEIIEEEAAQNNEAECTTNCQRKEKHVSGKRRRDLIASLQQLGDFEDLLAPPVPVISVANQAAAKAMVFLSGLTVGSGSYLDGMSLNDMPVNCSGNMRHLIVEACIARNILDTSAYLWPGYVKGPSNQIPRSTSGQMPGWSSLMKGSPLTPPMVNALVSTPASSLAEIEKIYQIAVNGSGDEKIFAAKILCGASLMRGWNIQEHTVLLITKLLSPPVPADYSGSKSHLIRYAPFLNVLLVGISSIDCIQIFSLHGVVPALAGALMPICEVFGSMVPWTLPTGEEISAHAVFSNAFTLLLKLWRFDRPPLEHVMGDVAPVGSQLTPEYLLLVRNSQFASYANTPRDQHKSKKVSKYSSPSSTESIFMDTFPKLKGWYRQHQECIAAILSGLKHGSPVHQIVDGLLNMMFRKVNGGSQSLTPTTSGSSNSSGPLTEDVSLQLKLPAWDILEAVPFVLDAALTAYAHGRLSPRELVTGLKDLADFLPASMATIVSYFSAEVTRGIWKPAFMNGTDWPSPAANLAIVEQQIKKILAGTGVDVPSLAAGGSVPATLPFPLAVLVSLTITYKLDRTAECLLFLIGPALISLAAGCPWPCFPIIASLWAQKVKRWSDFLIFSASRTVFHHNSDVVHQLLRSCFTSTLGLNSSPISSNGGVGALLGHGFGSHFSGRISPVAPGILYLRVHRSVRNVMFMTEEIVVLLMCSVKEIVSCGLPTEKMDKLKTTKYGMRYGQVSLAAAMLRVKTAATLGASLVWISGGLSLVQSLIRETLPSWFISDHKSELDGGDSGGMVAMLRGYALAYFAVLSGTFAWGVDSSSPASMRRKKVIGTHLDFLASALDGKISLGSDRATWRAYVSGVVSLMVGCTPMWLREVDVDVVKRVGKGLVKWNEEELALALLGVSGMGAMGAAAELIIEGEF